MTTARSSERRSLRDAFVRRRARVLIGSTTVALALGLLGALLAVPGDLGAITWAGVGLAWWGALGTLTVEALVLLVVGPRGAGRRER